MPLPRILLTLALIGADGQPATPPTPPSLPAPAGASVGRAPARALPSVPLTRRTGPGGASALLDTIHDNLCPQGIVDEMTVAACRCSVDVVAGVEPTSSAKESKPRTTADPEAQEAWPLTLREAIHIALIHSEIVQVFSPAPTTAVANCFGTKIPDRGYSGPTVLSRRDAETSSFRFQAELMAEVRSVEQQYWNLAQAHVQLWAADRAVSLATEVLDRERAELEMGRGTRADVAECAQRLEQLNIDLVTRTSDVITAERHLRNLLGLPPADNRRIIPVTPATRARIEPDWDASLSEMLAHQSDVVQQGALVRLAELQLIAARNMVLPLLGLETLVRMEELGPQIENPRFYQDATLLKPLLSVAHAYELKAGRGEDPKGFLNWQTGYVVPIPIMSRGYPLANARSAQYILLRSRAYYKQVVHQTTHSLARFFLEVDANHKQYRTASRLRKAAADRLDAQRAYYEDGRITVDRFLDAINQYATAVATEAQYLTTYNISIAALEEAKGTLLARDNIVIAEGLRAPKKTSDTRTAPGLAKSGTSKTDPLVKPASLATKPTEKTASPDPAGSPSGKTWSFTLSIGWTNPLLIKGTITSDEAR